MLLEDEAAHAEAIRRALKSSSNHFQVTLAGTLSEYHERVAAGPPDIALLDMVLPDGGAMELLASSQAANPFPLVIMTSHGDEQTAVEAMKAGALDYVVKSPQTFADMPRIVTHALDHWQLLQERRQAQQALQESEERYRSILEQMDDVYYEVDLAGNFTFLNESSCRKFGYLREELMGKSYGLTVPEDDIKRLFAACKAVFKSGEADRCFSHGILRKDGSTVLAESFIGLRKNKQGESIGFRTVSRDVTGRKQAEAYREMGREVLQILNGPGDLQQAIQSVIAVLKRQTGSDAVGIRMQDGDDFPYFAQQGFSSDFLAAENTLVERSADGGVCRDKDGNISLECTCGLVICGKTNPADPYFTRGGSCWTNDEAGTPFQDTRHSPRDRCLHEGFQSVVLAPIRNKERIVGLIQLNDMRKGRLTLELVELLESIASHIGEALIRKKAEEVVRESEEKYRMVVENAREAMVILVNGMFKFANSRIEELTGYSREELGAVPFTEFIHPDDRRTVADRYRQRLKGEAVPNIYPFRLVSKSGGIKWAEVSVTSITWEGKQATLNFMTDISDRKRLEEERQRVDKLESVGLLAGGIAHDFNNILTSILGNISLAKMDAAPGSELKNSLEQAEKASQRAKALTVQLLTFSKGGAPVLKLAPLTELLKDTAGFALSGSKVKCRFSIPAGLWHAEIDAGQVSQVIHNLVINAQQAMPNGGSIEISAENMALSETQSLGRGLPLAAGDYIRIAVADHGCGIPVENLEKVFDPFFTTRQKGNGMGLAVSFSIARQHGGHLSVESEPGTGSTFYLYLPASTQTAVPEQATEGTVKPAGNIKILVMDDEKGVREIAGRLLKHIGYKDIEFAEDGAEAIKLYKAAMKAGKPFSVAILDLTIAGGMGGEIAIQKLLQIDPGIKAIVSSGYIEDPVMAKHRDHGFSGVVAKPYTIEELRKAVQDVIPRPDRLPRPSGSQ